MNFRRMPQCCALLHFNMSNLCLIAFTHDLLVVLVRDVLEEVALSLAKALTGRVDLFRSVCCHVSRSFVTEILLARTHASAQSQCRKCLIQGSGVVEGDCELALDLFRLELTNNCLPSGESFAL